jgi:small subunit ribosomal protein S11
MAIKKAKARTKKSAVRQVPKGRANVHASYNNTIISISDLNGNVLGWSSAGHVGFKGPKKSTPYAASKVAEDVAKKVEAYGMKEVSVFIDGIGSGRDSAVKTLNSSGLSVLSVKDVTASPHNGCKPPKPRRL